MSVLRVYGVEFNDAHIMPAFEQIIEFGTFEFYILRSLFARRHKSNIEDFLDAHPQTNAKGDEVDVYQVLDRLTDRALQLYKKLGHIKHIGNGQWIVTKQFVQTCNLTHGREP